MKRNLLIIILLLTLIITGCTSNKAVGSKTIKVGEKEYVYQLEDIKISGTNNYFKITEKRSFDVKQTTGSWEISIPYTIHVDKADYTGYCILGSGETGCKDDNPKYNIDITNLNHEKDEYFAEVIITKK